MVWWLFGHKKRLDLLEKEIKDSFQSVKKDFDGVSKWIKHLHGSHGDVSSAVSGLKRELSTIKSDIDELKDSVSLMNISKEFKQLSKKQTAVGKQTAVYAVQKPVQTAVQTANFYDILQGLSGNERLVIFTLMNAADDMKLSYEDVARLLGKERSTIRGQINSIKKKGHGLIKEVRESNGKKRLYIEEEIKEKLAKYAKVRVKSRKKSKKGLKEE